METRKTKGNEMGKKFNENQIDVLVDVMNTNDGISDVSEALAEGALKIEAIRELVAMGYITFDGTFTDVTEKVWTLTPEDLK
jgi:hypothetical protein